MPLGIGSGSLGTLFVNLTANPAGVVAGMRAAEHSVLAGSKGISRVVARTAAAVTGGLAAIGATAVVQFGQFQREMTKSTAIMGHVSAELRAQMEATARQIATNSVTSSEKLAESYFFLASAGLNAQQSIAALSVVNKFAIAGQFDMARATDLLTDAQSALGLTVKDTQENMQNMTRISDVLVKANTLANASVEQFSTALTREAGAALKSFGIDVEEGVAVLAAFADQGVKAELAGTSLSRVLRLMTVAAVNNKEAYKEMGIEVFNGAGELNNLGDIVADLERELMGLSDQERVVALDTLGFQARVQGVILPLLGTSEAIHRYEAELRKAGGTTEEVSEKQMKDFFSQLTITWNRIKDILLTIGSQLTPVLEALNAQLSELVGTSEKSNKSFSTFKDTIAPAVITVIGMIGDAIYGWNLIIKGLRLAMSLAVQGMVKALDFLYDKFKNVTVAIIKSFMKLQAEALKIPGAMEVLGTGINFSPILNGLRNFDERMERSKDVIKDVVDSNRKELDDLVNKGSYSERLRKKYEAIGAAVEDPIKKAAEEVKRSTEEIQAAIQKAAQEEATGVINQEHASIFGPKGDQQGKIGFGSSQNLGFEGQAFVQLEQEKTALEERQREFEQFAEMEVDLTEETQRKKLEVIKAFNQEMQSLQLAQTQIILQASMSTFDSLAKATGDLAGQQSGVYKAMFAASKAFAIADATVSIAQGIAKAASLGFPAGIVGIAQVAAATAGIISSIQAVQLEFGGAREAGGPVSPGKSFLVGEKGPELFSPASRGDIIPNDALGGGGKVSVIVNNYGSATAEVKETRSGDDRIIEVVIDKAKRAIAADIAQGTGEVPRAMQNSFGLRRAGA